MTTNNKKISLIKQIDDLRYRMGQDPSQYDLIVTTLSETQLNYYLELTRDEYYYSTI